MILYHIMADTGCLPDDVIPQIPTNRMKGEDQEIPRICLGHTLDDCLTSIGIAHFVSKFLLAELRQNKKYSKDMPLPFIVRMYNIKDEDPNLLTEEETQKYVADSVVTSECWLTRYEKPVKIQKLWLVGGEVVLWPYIVDGVVYNYQTKAGKAHGFNRGMIGRTLELLWEKFQNNFVYIHVFVTTWHLKYDITDI